MTCQEIGSVGGEEECSSGNLVWHPDASIPQDNEARDLLGLQNAIRGSLRDCADSDRQTWERIFNTAWDAARMKGARPGLYVNTTVSELIDEVVVGPRGGEWADLVELTLRRYGVYEKTVRRSELTYSRNG